jgi:aryl-alcohol dehydrogenase-like predicted oxidoreductase
VQQLAGYRSCRHAPRRYRALIDHAVRYRRQLQSRRFESQLGETLGDRRKDVVLATKFASPMTKAETLRCASRRYHVRRRGQSYAAAHRLDDLYQLHWWIR